MNTISQIEISKSTYIGAAIRVIVTGLPSGARIAPPTSMPKPMYLRYLRSSVLLTRPMRASSSITTGVWNTIAKARKSSSTRLIVDSMP